MVIVQICVGSSCYLKGSSDIVKLMQENIASEKLEDDIALTGSFCTGKCNRVGVTVTIDDDTYTGITPEDFDVFFRDKVLEKLKSKGVTPWIV